MLVLENFLPYRLSVLSNRVSEGIAETYRERFGLSVTEWRVIAIAGRFEGVSASEVATRAAMDKVAVSRAVARLLDSGLISRRDSHSDRRSKALHLTAAGRAVYEQIAPAALAYEQKLLGKLSESERRQLMHLLERLEVITATER